MNDAAKAEPPKRKSQARSAATRESILDAALECLVERGYARTATADVAARAGVSRGAQMHHFRTRASLLAATVEHLAVRRLAELRRTLQTRSPGDDQIGTVIDFVWSAYSDAAAYAGLELVIAARTDDDLLEQLRPVLKRFDDTLRLSDLELSSHGRDRERVVAFRNLVIVAMQGLAVMNILNEDAGYGDGVLELLKDLGRKVLVEGTLDAS